MAEVGHDLVDALFHAVEVSKSRVTADHLVGENARQPWVGRGVEQFRLANGQQQAFCCRGVGAAILFAQFEVLLEGELLLASRFETLLEVAENAHDFTSLDAQSRCGFGQALGSPGADAAGQNPQNTKKSYRWPDAVWPALPCFGWPELKDSSESARSRAAQR